MSCKCSSTKRFIRGFSLLEVLITAAIIGIITGIAVVRYGAFNSSILLKNQAFEIALAVRQAQVFSISIRGQEVAGVPEFRANYGVQFDLADSEQKYTLFLDNGDTARQFDQNDQVVEEAFLDARFTISNLCATNNGGQTFCSASDPSDLDELTITFQRPNFDARFFAADGASVIANVNQAQISLQGIDGVGEERTIRIGNTGQISVE